MVHGLTVCDPPFAFLEPLHPPDATHEVAFCTLHESIEFPPCWIDAGFAVRFTVGAFCGGQVQFGGTPIMPAGQFCGGGVVTVTVAESETPLQVRV